VLIFDLKESGDVGAIAVLSLTMIVLTTIVIVIANRIGGSVRLTSRVAG
jgi:iron(III) transport system permease protein